MLTIIPGLTAARQLLTDAILDVSPPALDPLDISPWVAMSLLQKAIRRGQENLALQAAATLLMRSPENLWRRLGGIAFEDVGLADPVTVSLATAALAGKRFRAGLGGEWAVASLIVSKMALATKCRAVDDLLMAAERHPHWHHARLDFATVPISGLLSIALGTGPLPEKAVAVWYAVGTGWRSSRYLQRRTGQPKAVFHALDQIPGLDSAAEIAQEGFRKTGEVLCPLTGAIACANSRLEYMPGGAFLPPWPG